ncbi:MAG: histidine kinase, partial [Candidatus Aminicenantaceae bacterium]
IRDITKRKRTEDKLRESENSLANAQRVAKVGSYEFDLKTNTITYSDEMCNILGLDKESYIPTAEGFEKIVHPNDRYKMSREAFDVALSTKKHEIQYRIIDQTTKEIKHIHNWEETIYDTDGTLSKIAGVFQDITGRKHAEEQVVSLAKFPSENPNPVLRVSRKGSILYANDASKPLFDDWGSKISQLVPAHLNKLITESLDSGQGRIEEIKSGDRILSFIIAPIVDAGYVNLYGRDITARKHAEEQVVSLAKFPSENPNPVLRVSREGFILYANEASKPLLDDWGSKIGQLVPAHCIKLITESLNSGQCRVEEIRHGDKMLSCVVAPIVDTGYVNLYIRDITERKQAEQALQLERDNLIHILEAMVDGVYIVNQQYDIEYVNLVLKNEFGPLNGKKCYAYFHDRTKVCPWCKNSDVFAGKTVRWEWYSNKTKRTYDLVDAPLRHTDGTISKLEIFRDITERKLAEDELKGSREELKNLAAHLQSGREEERTSIAREIHDELGQALTALKMDLFWLRKRLPEDQRPYLEKIQSMVDLTDRTIVTMKRISTDLRPSMLDDLGLVAAIQWQAEEFQKRTGIKCDAAIDFEEIELDEDKRTAIFRIFQETLTNIARHADATRARFYLRKRAKSLELEVRDNGKGITEEQISDPKAYGLIGIRERVQFMEGEVTISGAPDRGTKVLVKIPLPDIGAAG